MPFNLFMSELIFYNSYYHYNKLRAHFLKMPCNDILSNFVFLMNIYSSFLAKVSSFFISVRSFLRHLLAPCKAERKKTTPSSNRKHIGDPRSAVEPIQGARKQSTFEQWSNPVRRTLPMPWQNFFAFSWTPALLCVDLLCVRERVAVLLCCFPCCALFWYLRTI